MRAQHAEVAEQDGIDREDFIKARPARQEILERPEPPTLHFVLSESCLRRVWGPPEVMREQIEHLIKLSKRPNVFVQVPFDLPPAWRVPLLSGFTLLRVPSPGAAGPLELAWVEGHGEIRYLDDKKALATHEAGWTRLSNAARRYDETRKFLTQVARAFDEAYAAALTAARESLDLTDLFACLEHWRRVALLQRDPSRFASIARRAAERLTGRAVPPDEALAETRRRAGI